MSIREPFEPPSVKEWALIIHADSSGERVDVYWADMNAGREGLRLAREVKAWRRRDDLLTLGRRLRIAIPNDDESTDAIAYLAKNVPVPEATGGMVEPVLMTEPDEPELFVPEPEPSMPPEPATEPVGASTSPDRIESRHDYLAGRVRAIVAHSETAKMALARSWPEGVSGLRNDGQSWEELDLILDAVIEVEKNHSVPFYPEWVDPDIEQAIRDHPSNVWARPKETPSTEDDRNHIQEAIMAHPRSALLREWISMAVSGGIDHNIDTTALAHALTEFASLDPTQWPDADLTVMLDGSLRALGYVNGCNDLGKFNPDHAPLLMSAAFAITAGNAYLLFGEDGQPIVRTNVRPNSR